MNDFNLVSLFYIALETLTVWFWPTVIVALLLVLGVVTGFRSLRKYGKSAGKPLFASLVAGLLGTAVGIAMLPSLTGASLSDLSGAVDYILLLFMATGFGLAIFALVFSVVARKCARPA